MSSITGPATPAPADDQNDITDEVGWTQTRFEDDHRQWWKADSNHVHGSHTTLHVRRLASRWSVTVEAVNKYGLTESSKTIQRTKTDRQQAEERCLRHARDYMLERPPERPFTGEPELPDDIGDWELVDVDTREWTWGVGDQTLEVRHAGFTDVTGSTASRHTLVYRAPDGDEHVIVEEAPTLRAVRSAERCMATNPDGRLGDPDILEGLQSVPGIGPCKARDLQLLGLPCRSALEAAIYAESGELDHELEAALDRLLPTRTVEHFTR